MPLCVRRACHDVHGQTGSAGKPKKRNRTRTGATRKRGGNDTTLPMWPLPGRRAVPPLLPAVLGGVRGPDVAVAMEDAAAGEPAH